MNRRAPLVLAATALVTALILGITLHPTGADTTGAPRFCILCGEQGTANLLLNIALYGPLGFALGLKMRSVAAVTLVGFFLSLSIEAVQLWIPGRFSSLADLLANAVGAGIGAWLAKSTRSWAPADDRTAAILTRAWGVSATLLILGSCHLLSPSVPPGNLYAGWTPELGRLEVYDGQVLSATIGGEPLPPGPLQDSVAVRARLRDGATISAVFVVGPPPSAPAPLLHVTTGAGGETFLVSVAGRDVILRSRFVANDLGFSSPDFRFPEVLHDVSVGDTVDLTATPSGAGGFLLRVGSSTREMSISPARSWSLLFYGGGIPPWAATGVDVLFLAALFLPIGFWAPSLRVLTESATPPLLALIMAPLWWPVSIAPLTYLVALPSGLCGGRWARGLGAPGMDGVDGGE